MGLVATLEEAYGMSNHGYVTSCLGPVVDVQVASALFELNKEIFKTIQEALTSKSGKAGMAINVDRDIFYPSVYDSISIQRPSVCFREGITLSNCLSDYRAFMSQITYQESYLLAVSYLVPADYEIEMEAPAKGVLQEGMIRTGSSIESKERIDIVLGFAALYMLVRSYANSLVAEVSQQMYGGILRCIALGSTEGLSTWKCGIHVNLQPVIVPVGKLALGRILNVLGTSVDSFNDLPTTIAFGIDNIWVSSNCKEGIKYKEVGVVCKEEELEYRNGTRLETNKIVAHNLAVNLVVIYKEAMYTVISVSTIISALSLAKEDKRIWTMNGGLIGSSRISNLEVNLYNTSMIRSTLKPEQA